MTHQIVYRRANAPYMGTETSFEKSMSMIMAMLERYQVDDLVTRKNMQTLEGGGLKDPVPFHTLAFRKSGFSYVIEFPIIIQENWHQSGSVRKITDRRLRMDVSARIIHDRLKALLIGVDLEISNFASAMMPYLAIPDRASGRLVPLQDVISAQQEQLKSGGFDLLALPEARR